MRASDPFPFAKLPLELRLKVYQYTLPSRVLQFGYNFPFPFLPAPTSDGAAARAARPTPTKLPFLFHVWHESRAFCLSKYIPFAYTYAHPTLDTLYFTQHAGSILSSQRLHMHSYAKAPLYPITLLQRVAIEIDTFDISKRAWRGTPPCGTLKYIKEAMKMFGFPKELLLFIETADKPTGTVARGRVKGWDEFELVENSPSGEGRDDELAEYVTQVLLQRQRQLDDWLVHGIPRVQCVDVVKKGKRTAKSLAKIKQLQDPADETAKKWLNAEAEGGKIYYDLWDTAKRLRRAGIKLPTEWGLDS